LHSLELFLRSWWSKTYNRPLKDPLLEQYSIYELIYEYNDKIERKNAQAVSIDQENDKIEEAQEKQVLDWVEEEEKKEREAREAAQKKKDEEWMLEQLKKERGEDFGEDINLDF
jgi:hypothetical protein